jgi:hypothetical protein
MASSHHVTSTILSVCSTGERVGIPTAVEYDQADAEALRARRTDVTVLHADIGSAPSLALPGR